MYLQNHRLLQKRRENDAALTHPLQQLIRLRESQHGNESDLTRKKLRRPWQIRANYNPD